MKVHGREYEVVEMEVLSNIGAGSVVPFPEMPNGEAVPVLIPKGVPKEMIGLLMVSGPSLEQDGIYDGDILAFRRDFKLKDITASTICSVFIRSTGEILAKKVMYTHNSIVLRSSGGGFPDKHYSPDEIEVQGICYSFVRMADRIGRFSKAKEDDYEF